MKILDIIDSSLAYYVYQAGLTFYWLRGAKKCEDWLSDRRHTAVFMPVVNRAACERD